MMNEGPEDVSDQAAEEELLRMDEEVSTTHPGNEEKY